MIQSVARFSATIRPKFLYSLSVINYLNVPLSLEKHRCEKHFTFLNSCYVLFLKIFFNF